jgi:hypothetical protein
LAGQGAEDFLLNKFHIWLQEENIVLEPFHFSSKIMAVKLERKTKLGAGVRMGHHERRVESKAPLLEELCAPQRRLAERQQWSPLTKY